MWNKIRILMNGFLIGMLFEYTIKVEVSPYPIIIGILLVVSFLYDNFWIDKLEVKKKKKLITEIEVKAKEKEIENIVYSVPKGWMVYNSGQDPLHMLWYINFIHFDDLANGVEDPRQVFVEEYDTWEDALKKGIKEIKLVNVEKV